MRSFKMHTKFFPKVIELSSLDKKTGFTISKKFNSEHIGSSVYKAGDVNADGVDDLLIGAEWASPAGRYLSGAVYVVFGKSAITSDGFFDLSTLNGSNGFIIMGISNGDYTGSSVSSGDINGDGIPDIIIGADLADSGGKESVGFCYVVFGRQGIGGTGSLDLSTLNGSNGFVMHGVNSADLTGTSISTGDINADGIADVIVGAPASFAKPSRVGHSYVVFGKKTAFSAGLELSTLNGINGFIINGVVAGDRAGVVSSADVNDDGITDIVIGASDTSPAGRTRAGTTYVVFGKSGIGSGGILELSKLNGVNGFAINGVSQYEASGYFVSGAGDINSDGVADLAIGAIGASPGGRIQAGASYVVFGKSGIGGNGTLELSTLNGTNGFTINGVMSGDDSGFVGRAGDVNGDGIADLIIGAPYAEPGGRRAAGVSYVVFGKVGVGSSGILELSALDGNNGFAINGFISIGNSGCSVSGAGDLNADGIDDFVIGADQAGDSGTSYLIFGDAIPKTVANRLTIAKGKTVLVDSSNMRATRVDKLDLELIFTIDQLTHGHFEQVDRPGIYITSFSQESVVANKIQFIHDSSNTAPTYSIKVTSRIAANSFEAAEIHFIHLGPALINNTLTLNQGESLVLNANMLSATDLDGKNFEPDLLFRVNQLQYGRFFLIDSPQKPIYQFKQLQITNHEVRFVHDGTAHRPSYSISVSDGTDQDAISTPPQDSKINFNFAPVLVNNKLTIIMGTTHILTNNDLSASDPDDDPGSLIFQISNLQHGQFATKQEPTTPILTFMQNQIQGMNIIFVHDGTQEPPRYAVSVSDGQVTTSPEFSKVTFYTPPILIRNSLVIFQGQNKILTTNDLNARDQKVPAEELIFTASGVRYGQFEELAVPGQIVMQFAQQKVIQKQIQFIPMSHIAPQYNISVSNGMVATQPLAASITFYNEKDPMSSDNTVRNAIIGSVVSGVVGLGFFLFQLYVGRKVARTLETALEGGVTEMEKRLLHFRRDVLRPVAHKIFDQIKTTNLIGYRSGKETKAYISVIETLLSKLDELGVNLNVQDQSAAEQNRLFTEIARQTRLHVVTNKNCCSCSFFKAEMTPAKLEKKLTAIATDVQVALNKSGKAEVKNVININEPKIN